MVMTGHIAVPALEPGVPASVSKPAYAELRRMGFDGVAVTDALNMGAIRKQYPARLRRAAGPRRGRRPAADARRTWSRPTPPSSRAVNSGALPPERLAEAAQRVVTMMIWRGRAGAKPGAEPGSGAELSQQGLRSGHHRAVRALRRDRSCRPASA